MYIKIEKPGLEKPFLDANYSTRKIIRVNETDVYYMGGNDEEGKKCAKVDLTSGEVIEKATMGLKRNSFGIAHIGNHIYVIGGC